MSEAKDIADAKLSSLEDMVRSLRSDLNVTRKAEKQLREEKGKLEKDNGILQSQLDAATAKTDEQNQIVADLQVR